MPIHRAANNTLSHITCVAYRHPWRGFAARRCSKRGRMPSFQANMRMQKAVAASASMPRSPGRLAIVVAASAAARYSTGDCTMLFMICELTPVR